MRSVLAAIDRYLPKQGRFGANPRQPRSMSEKTIYRGFWEVGRVSPAEARHTHCPCPRSIGEWRYVSYDYPRVHARR
jgi:hypothetical protein